MGGQDPHLGPKPSLSPTPHCVPTQAGGNLWERQSPPEDRPDGPARPLGAVDTSELVSRQEALLLVLASQRPVPGPAGTLLADGFVPMVLPWRQGCALCPALVSAGARLWWAAVPHQSAASLLLPRGHRAPAGHNDGFMSPRR